MITFFLKKLNTREKPVTSENVHQLIRTGSLIEEEAEQQRNEMMENQTFH